AQESAGEVPYSNVLRMQSQLYGAEQSMVAQKSSVLQSRFQFNQVRNRPSEEVCTLEPLAVEKDGFIFASEVVGEALLDEKSAASIRDYLVDLGLARSPKLRSLEAQLMAERRRMKSGRRWLIPSLDAAAAAAVFLKTGGEGSGDSQGGTAGAQGGDVFWQLGLQLNWSVLDGGAYIASMNQSKLELWSLESQRNNTETALEETIRGTAAAAMVAFERIGLAVLQAQAAAENYELVNEAYLDGESTLLNLIDAQDVLISANTTARQALYEFLSDLLTLEQSIAYYPFLEADADARVRELESHLRK
ncbi:MAG: TolC family protein, partial [Polyangiales bacterium]